MIDTLAVPGVRLLRTRTAVIDFFELVLSDALSFPAVVVTRPTASDEPLLPLAELHSAVSDIADVYYLDGVDLRNVLTGSPAHPLEDVNVYGGATRVFPAGQWDDARLFLTRTSAEGRVRVRHIARHVRELSTTRGSLSYTTSTQSSPSTDDAHRASASVRVVDLEADNAALREQVDRLTRAAASRKPTARPKAPVERECAPQTSRRMFADAGDEVRFRVMALWAELTTPQEKIERPLPRYAFGPDFARAMEEVGGSNAVLFDKVARCVLRILLGQDRDGHKLDITGKTREDGAVAWRSYVEQKTASARRLHYWRLPGGGVELSRVVLHDDYTA